MSLRILFVICIVFSLFALTSCPNGGDETTQDGAGAVVQTTTDESGNVVTNVEPPAGDDGANAQNPPDGQAPENTEGTGSTEGEGETAPPAWSIEGIKAGEPITLAIDAENTITFKYELPTDCHWNENDPLGMAVTFVPDGVKIDPLEVTFPKPADVPSEVVFKITGIKAGVADEIAFDIMTFFCSNEGFCMRKPDTVKIPITAGDSKEPAKYTVVYKLTTE